MPESSRPSRRDFIAASAAAMAASLAAGSARAEAEAAPTAGASTKPLNVLFFMSDDMRPELACYGSRFHPHTPNLDRLAAQGVRFDRNFCQYPLCNPSRSSLMTGHPPHTTGVIGNSASVRNLHPNWTTLPQLFREHGYTTLRAGKIFHAGLDDPKAWTDFDGDVESASMKPTQQGVKMEIPRSRIPMPDGVLPNLPQDNERSAHSDQILVLEGNGEGAGDYLVADRAIRYLGQVAKDGKPFFVACGFSKPHSPPQAPQRFFDLYDPAKIELPPNFAAWPTVPADLPKAAIRMRNADLFIGRGASEDEARQVIRAYLAAISWADWNLGRVLAELDRLKLRESTVVVFVADHGYQLGERGKWSKAGSLFENGCRVPLIIHSPGMHGNGRPSLRVVQSLDLYRTLTELAGLPNPDNDGPLEGHSLVPLLQNPQAAWDHPAYSIWSEDGKSVHGTTVRTEQFRYAEFGPKAANGAMLFDAHADPLELTNLADQPKYAADRARLSKLVNEYSYPAG
jgi:iduronate 2-sulfatase